MKSGKIIIIAPIVLLLLIVVNIVVLAELHPYRPGDAFFGIQSAVENTQLKLISHPQKRVEFSFGLVERRLADLEMIDQQVQVQPAVDAFDLAMTSKNKNCMDCHADGEYMDKASECSQCHVLDVYFASKLGTEYYRPQYLEEDYPYHFGGDCKSCHQAPANHASQGFTAQCGTCHSSPANQAPRARGTMFTVPYD
ncbi:MAG: hypothetical protein CVU41_08260 [Chloroflexi bacterium HGW-Chloroflexi-3]|nr:MAG: hypothetical protein CVU41_08260 [Chloroflexi bacterium HGW-Chloroflexi-3]